MLSTAQTGYIYTTTRLRTGAKLSQIKYDPMGLYYHLLREMFPYKTSSWPTRPFPREKVQSEIIPGSILYDVEHNPTLLFWIQLVGSHNTDNTENDISSVVPKSYCQQVSVIEYQ